MQMIAEIYGLPARRHGAGRVVDIRQLSRAGTTGCLRPIWSRSPPRWHAPPTPTPGEAIPGPDRGPRGPEGETGRWTVIDAQTRAAPLPAVEAAVAARVLSGAAHTRAEGAGAVRQIARRAEPVGRRIWKARSSPARSSHTPKASRSSRRPAPRRDGRCRWPRIAENLARGLHSSVRCCWVTWRARWWMRPRGNWSLPRPLPRICRRMCPPCEGSCRRRWQRGCRCPRWPRASGISDMLRQARGTANLIQGLRDRFGAHGFARIDRPGENRAATAPGALVGPQEKARTGARALLWIKGRPSVHGAFDGLG